MFEHDLNPAATKFISSLVKSLQILCNGQVDFNESIELIGHINVRVDHIHKINYIVDEHVSKEGSDSSTTFLSNSYHSFPPSKHLSLPPSAVQQQSQPESHSHPNQHQLQNVRQDIPAPPVPPAHHHSQPHRGAQTHTVKVSHKAPSNAESSQKQDNVMVKMEGGDNDCMVLPASPEDYEPVEDIGPHEGGSLPGTSSTLSENFEIDYDLQQSRVSNQTSKKRKTEDQSINPEEGTSESKAVRGDGKSSGGKRGASELIGKFAAYECSYCSVILTEYEDLTLHSKNCPSPSCSMICLTCGEKLPNKPEMRQHLKLAHSHKTFGCKYCDMMFLSSSGLLSHTKAKHRPDAKTLCQLCGQAFHNKANLEGHMNMHLGIRPFKCKRCGKSYGHSKSLITHEKMCKSIVCSPKTISSKGLNRSHIRSQNKANANSNTNTITKPTIQLQVQEIPKKDIERKEVPSTTPVSAESSQNQAPIVYETYQPTYEGREEKRDTNSSERTMTLIPNANQNFTFTPAPADASTYPQSFTEPITQSSLVMSAMNSPNPANVHMANPVYAHPNTSFVLPQVAYGMYQHGILPDQR